MRTDLSKTEMKKYVFIVTDRNRHTLHVGLSANILRTMDFYKKIPSLLFDAGGQLTRLVYFEELNDAQSASTRFQILNRYTRAQMEKTIRSVNADWTDLTSALKYEAATSNVRLSPHVLSFAS